MFKLLNTMFIFIISALSNYFNRDESGETTASGIVGAIVALSIGLIVISAIVPTSIDQLYSADTSGWTINSTEDTRTTAMWELLPLFAVLGVLLIIIAIALKFV